MRWAIPHTAHRAEVEKTFRSLTPCGSILVRNGIFENLGKDAAKP